MTTTNDEHNDFTIFENLENGLILRRDERGVWTNVPHLVTHHSPTGFEFGYAGSGPADLALNVVEVVLNRLGYHGERVACWQGDCWDKAFELHQRFKFQFIASAPREGCIVSYADIEGWVKERLGA